MATPFCGEWKLKKEAIVTVSVSNNEKPWLKHYEKGIPETIQFEETCIPAFLKRSAKEFPDHTALLFQGFKVTFSELNDMVNRFSTCRIRISTMA